MRKCQDCGHEHPTMATASRGTASDAMTTWSTRYFCHESDHSCYQRRYGNYWDDKPVVGVERALEIINDALKKGTT